MAQKWQTISELAADTSRKVTHSPEEWCRFLTTAARFYKAYDFDDQLLIYAQKPDATACADMSTWNNKMRRWVNAGSTAIALIRKGYGGKPYLDYVHDVADTHPVRGGKDPWLWKLTEENREPVIERLRSTFGIDGAGDLGDLLMEVTDKLVQESYGEYLPDLLYEREDSFLEGLDDFNVEVLFRNTLRASVQYAVLSRCGLDVNRYLDTEDFREITNFNTTAALACLGTAVKSSGLEHFDSWAANFGETTTALELAPEGTGFRSKTRFAKFFNLPELMAMWREAADIQTADMLRLPVPEAEKITEVTTPSDFQRDLVADLGERAEAVRNREVEPREDNMLKITSDGRKLALDQRLSDPTLPDDPESKVNTCVRNVLQVWRDTEKIKGTQLVFCDLSTPKGDGSFNVYDDMKQKLMAQGVPPEEIAFIHDAKTEVQKAELFSKVRKGQVRVLLGSTAKMGAGTNVQTRLAALHHLDCPWRPADIEQREGRILRQGNINKTVKIYKYVTENTFDAYNWSILENKQKFIGQLMSGKNPSRSCEDVDEAALSYAEVKALASGDPRIIEMTDLDSQVTKLKLLKANHEGQRYQLEDQLIQFFPKAISRTQEQITGLEQDLAVVQAHPLPDKEHFSITVAGQTYTERKAAGQAIIDACTKMTDVAERVPLGEYRGFPMTLWADTSTQKFQVTMKHSLSHTIELGSDPVGNIARLENALAAIADHLEQNRGKLENLNAQMEEAKLEVKRPFPQEQELAEKTSRLNVLRIALNMDGKSTGKRERDKEELDGGKPSIKGMLKRLGVESAATASTPQKGKDMEVAI